MRAKMLSPLLFSGLFLLLTALLLLWGSPSTFGETINPAWTNLGGPRGGPAQALAVNPNYPAADQTLLAGGGHDLFYASWKGAGIFRSPDGGLTWGAPAGPVDGAVLDVAFSPRWVDDSTAVAGLWDGAWITHDRGATWHLFAAGNEGVWRLSDGSWQPVNNGM
jgi:hypothetical protein